MPRLRFSLCFLLLAACDCGGGAGEPCLSTASCPTGHVCIDSVCVDPDDRTPCATAVDCDAGELCIDGLCTDRDVEPGCEDLDGDGYGEGCSLGDDCDDTNPAQNGREVCDGMDNDCDGEIDNGVLSACGNCDPTCMSSGFGIPDGMPWDISNEGEDESDGVGVDDEGALVLDSRRINTNFIWIANTGEGTVSRLSTTAPYEEVGRYYTGPEASASSDPSRTSVNSVGDAYVANRRGTGLVRISVLGDSCPDSNGDGAITTSQDLNGDGIISRNLADGELLPWGEDDCVLWFRDLDDVFPGETLVRALAAQDVAGLDGDVQEYVWVGGHATSMVAKIDGETGEPLFSVQAPVATYGFALDGNGQLWISGRGNRAIGRVDTNRCVDLASCSDAICIASAGEGTECDTAVKARIPAPHRAYGITVDFNQRVWLGGDEPHPTLTYDARFSRYDPSAAGGSRWITVDVTPNGHVINGIAADADGWVWGAGWSTAGIIRIEADNPSNWITVPGTLGVNNKGMAIDAEGKVWSITNGNNQALVVTPGPTIDDNTLETGVGASTLVSNYTYSDMTGLQLRLATNPRGFYRHIFEACDGGEVDWADVVFDAEIPPGTNVSFRVKTAPTRAELDLVDWVAVGMTPPDVSPLSIAAALMGAGVVPERFLLLEIALQAERSSSTEVITPRVRSVDVTHTCVPIVE
ncbi:MAG: hypothetical protein JJ863_07025 [Deltaproteobacteria bacterium]|nr:hypothetical protein [Deltaproteobacteria bacterium]